MKSIRKVMVLCAFIAGAGWAPASLAADATGTEPKAFNKDAVCTKCHDQTETKVWSYYQTRHGVKGDSRTPSCQSCHGESQQHLAQRGRTGPDVVFKKGAFAASDTKAMNAACLSCHDKDANRTHWAGSTHQVEGLACVSCHAIHNAHDKVRDRKTQTEVCFTCHKEQRADSYKISTHPIDAGKVVCSDCHNPHGSAGPKLLKKNTVTELCTTCHAEKRGPFLWEHQPVTEDCTNCHTPHGSNIAPLLKSRPPFLCDECHDGPHNSTLPYGPGAAVGRPGAAAGYGDRSAAGRACMNCHNMIHGSNSPSGAFLHR